MRVEIVRVKTYRVKKVRIKKIFRVKNTRSKIIYFNNFLVDSPQTDRQCSPGIQASSFGNLILANIPGTTINNGVNNFKTPANNVPPCE